MIWQVESGYQVRSALSYPVCYYYHIQLIAGARSVWLIRVDASSNGRGGVRRYAAANNVNISVVLDAIYYMQFQTTTVIASSATSIWWQ